MSENDINGDYKETLKILNNLKDLCENENKRGKTLGNNKKKASNKLKKLKISLKESETEFSSLSDQYNKNKMKIDEKNDLLKRIDEIKVELQTTEEEIKKMASSIDNTHKEHPMIKLLDDVYEQLGVDIENEEKEPVVPTSSSDYTYHFSQNAGQLVSNEGNTLKYDEHVIDDGDQEYKIFELPDLSANGSDDDKISSQSVKDEEIAAPAAESGSKENRQVDSQHIETKKAESSFKGETQLSPDEENEQTSMGSELPTESKASSDTEADNKSSKIDQKTGATETEPKN